MSQIEELRIKITEIDAEIIELIAKRKQISLEIGAYKKQHNLPVLDSARESLLREFHDTVCEEYNLAPSMVAKLFELLIEESRKVQQNER
ncbi:MAG: chorismate mutase [Burkholderiales bacterium]|nr:chorismate mutase [Burkholderiales bacterium]